jgi:hypothetical protein
VHRLPRLLLATAIMGSLIAGGDALAASWLDMAGSQLARIASLGLLVVFGLGVYLLALQAFGVTSPRILLKAVRERL